MEKFLFIHFFTLTLTLISALALWLIIINEFGRADDTCSLTFNLSYILILPQFGNKLGKVSIGVPLFSQTRLSFCRCCYTIAHIDMNDVDSKGCISRRSSATRLTSAIDVWYATNRQTNTKQARVRLFHKTFHLCRERVINPK